MYLYLIQKLEVFTKFEDVSDLNFIYNDYENITIKENGKSDFNKEYFSICQIDESYYF